MMTEVFEFSNMGTVEDEMIGLDCSDFDIEDEEDAIDCNFEDEDDLEDLAINCNFDDEDEGFVIDCTIEDEDDFHFSDEEIEYFLRSLNKG